MRARLLEFTTSLRTAQSSVCRLNSNKICSCFVELYYLEFSSGMLKRYHLTQGNFRKQLGWTYYTTPRCFSWYFTRESWPRIQNSGPFFDGRKSISEKIKSQYDAWFRSGPLSSTEPRTEKLNLCTFLNHYRWKFASEPTCKLYWKCVKCHFPMVLPVIIRKWTCAVTYRTNTP